MIQAFAPSQVVLSGSAPGGRTESAGPAPGTRPLHVAVIDEELPYPPTSGKRIRTLSLLLRLAWRHHITCICPRNADAEEARQAAAFLHDHGVRTVLVDRPVPRQSGPLFYARLAANLLSRFPYSVATLNSRPLRQAIQAHAASHPVDLWQCEWTPHVAALRGVAKGPRLVMAQNVESLIWQRYSETERNPLKRWYINRQWHKFERFERQAFAEATCTVAVSAEDASRMREQFGARRVAVVDNGVDTTYFRPQDVQREPGQILFLGSLDWRPNLDAVGILLDQVWPRVQAQEPGVRLHIVGRKPPAWLERRLRALPGVELHANVADVRSYLARSAVLAVPLRIGGGSRLKILEALACELPVVSTRIGAEGLCLESGRHLVVVPGVEEMAEALLCCLRDPWGARAMAKRGCQIVAARYDWDVLSDRLEQVWLDCLKAPPEQPNG